MAKKSKQKFNYFLVTSKALFLKEDQPKERTLNTLLKLDDPVINAESLRMINRATIQRVTTESKVESKDIVDVVILNMAHLGYMTEEVWSQESDVLTDTTESENEDEGNQGK